MGINNPPSSSEWILLDTINFAGDNTKTSAALTAYSKYKIVFNNVKAAANLQLNLTINGVAGTAYTNFYMSNTTPTIVGNAAYAIIGFMAATTKHAGEILIQGIASATSPFALSYMCGTSGYVSQVVGMSGFVNMTSGEQVSTITFTTSASNLTSGTFKIYGAN